MITWLKMFAAFPHALTAYTSTNDTAFKCSSATRTLFDPQAKTVTYVWHFKAHSGHRARDAVLDVFFGETPGQGTFFVNQDSAHSYTAFYEYSDYATCTVVKFPFEGHDHCSLWIKKAVKYNVPRNCLKAYEETCDYRVSLMDRNICKDEED